jgi:hypothetical protein
MLSFLRTNSIPTRCELISPTSNLVRRPGKCVPVNSRQRGQRKYCKELGRLDCRNSELCEWNREQPSRCSLEGPTRKKKATTLESTCPICFDTLFEENRWGCKCGHPICNTCFQKHVLETGFKCPVCQNFCDKDGICRNKNVHEEELRGELQQIFCPMCRAECLQCFSLQVRK